MRIPCFLGLVGLMFSVQLFVLGIYGETSSVHLLRSLSFWGTSFDPFFASPQPRGSSFDEFLWLRIFSYAEPPGIPFDNFTCIAHMGQALRCMFCGRGVSGGVASIYLFCSRILWGRSLDAFFAYAEPPGE